MEGHLAKRGDDVTVKYRGTLESDGSEFDSASRFDFMLGVSEVIKAGTRSGYEVGGSRRCWPLR